MTRATGAAAHDKNKNRAVRQEALRESLQAGGHIQHVLDICNELNDLSVPMEGVDVQRKKTVIDTKLKLISKYLPDTKSVELSNKVGETFKTDNKWTIEVVDA